MAIALLISLILPILQVVGWTAQNLNVISKEARIFRQEDDYEYYLGHELRHKFKRYI